MMNSTNYTDPLFAIQNSAERYFWTIYHVFILLSSLFGDSLILFASFQKDAFKLHSFIVVVIRYIAVCDIGQSIFTVIPRTLSLITNSWIFSDALCRFQDIMNVFIGVGVAWLTPVLTTSKFLLVKYPLRSTNWTKNLKAHMVCCFSFFPSALLATSKVIVDDEIAFDFRVYVCTYNPNASIWNTMQPILAFIVLVLPNTILIATTIPTLKYLYTASKSARRVQGSIPWQGAVTVSLTAIVYCISYLPFSVYYIGANFVEARFFEVHLFRFANFFCAINIMSNIYIYALTIKSFRRFLLSRILALNGFSIITNSAERGSTTGNLLYILTPNMGKNRQKVTNFRNQLEATNDLEKS